MKSHNKHYKQLTQGERYQIHALLRKGVSCREIAVDLGRHATTIYREVKRNSNLNEYVAEVAHRSSGLRQRRAKKYSKQNAGHDAMIENGLLLGWSPENMACRMRLEQPDRMLSHTTIYRRIEANKAAGGDWYKQLIRFGKSRWKGGKRKAGRDSIPNRVDICERPAIVEQRSRCGDWEGDTVYGDNAHLVTLVDRTSLLTLIGKVASKNADTVANKMITLLKRVDKVHTITLDNGGEFTQHAKVAKATKADVYFARPYASYQRGSNENTNGLIRRCWPKKMKFGKLNHADIEEMEWLINLMPRKVLGGLTPLEAYTGRSVALIA